MNDIVKEKWLEALRSGKYKQATEVLRTDNHFCCLGVLCDLYSKEKRIKWGNKEDGARTFLRSRNYLPDDVQKWAGIRTGSGAYGDLKCLANDNDTGKSFSKIADIIEKEF